MSTPVSKLRRLLGSVLCGASLFAVGCSSLDNPVSHSSLDNSPSVQATAQDYAVPVCEEGVQPSGALYKICMPAEWNGNLVVYAHGYLPPMLPLHFAPETDEVAPMFLSQGFAFAATTYRVNGLSAAAVGPDDVRELVEIFENDVGSAGKVMVVGFSLGGTVVIRLAEEHGDVIDGVLACNGFNANFRKEVNHVGDLRTLFDYFFPGVIPGTTIDVPLEVIVDWEAVYVPAIIGALQMDPEATRQLLSVTKIPVDPSNPLSGIQSIAEILSLQVTATSDNIARLGGNPYDNRYTLYRGSDNDRKLNRTIARYRADGAALETMRRDYRTTGEIDIPVVSMHNTGDAIVPIVQQFLYRLKVLRARRGRLFTGIPVPTYGHVEYTPEELASGFGALVEAVLGE